MNGRIGDRVIRRERVTSTMDEVTALATQGEPEGTVVVANLQTAGRGRLGRAWVGAPGTGLFCSILLRPKLEPARLQTLPLVVGVAVAEALESIAPVYCQLKWPNDVLIDGGKVGGILVTARTAGSLVDWACLGIGVNTSATVNDLPDGATSLVEASGQPIDQSVLESTLFTHIDAVFRSFVESNGRMSLDPWRARAVLLDERVRVMVGNASYDGRLVGVADDGSLLVAGDNGTIQRFTAGEVMRGPRRIA